MPSSSATPSVLHLATRTWRDRCLRAVFIGGYGLGVMLLLVRLTEWIWQAGPWWAVGAPALLFGAAALAGGTLAAGSGWAASLASQEWAAELVLSGRLRYGSTRWAQAHVVAGLRHDAAHWMTRLEQIPEARRRQIVALDRALQRQLCQISDPEMRRRAIALIASVRGPAEEIA